MEMNWNRRELLSRVPALAAGMAAALPAMSSAATGAASRTQGLATQQAGAANDDGIEREYLDFRAEDQGRTWGQYYRPKGKNPKTAVLIMHPNQNQSQEFLTRRLAAYGYGVLGVTARWYPDPMRATPELSLLDIASHIKFLRDKVRRRAFYRPGPSRRRERSLCVLPGTSNNTASGAFCFHALPVIRRT